MALTRATGKIIGDSNGNLNLSGIVTATNFVGNITGNPTGSGANLTNLPAGQLTGTVADARISTLTASKLSGALPAISAANLTNVPAANITGTLPAISGASLTGVTAVGLSTTASLNTSGIVTATAFAPTIAQFSHRNLLINGDMKISQRSTSQASIASGTSHVLDRWGIEVTQGGGAQVTMSQDNQAPEGFSKSLKIEVTTADTSIAAGERWQVRQRIEGQDLRRLKYGTSNALQCIFSFFVRSNVTGTFAVGLYQQDGGKINSGNYTINSADTWEKKTIIINGNTADAMNDDNTLGFQVGIGIAAGTNFSSGTATGNWVAQNNTQYPSQTNLLASVGNNLFFTGCQLEVGPVATPFEHRSAGDELKRCQRYYQQYVNPCCTGVIPDNGSKAYSIGLQFQTRMRAAPTLTITNAGSGQNISDGQSSVNISSLNAADRNVDGASIYLNLASDLGDFRPACLGRNDSTSDTTTYKFAAEL